MHCTAARVRRTTTGMTTRRPWRRAARDCERRASTMRARVSDWSRRHRFQRRLVSNSRVTEITLLVALCLLTACGATRPQRPVAVPSRGGLAAVPGPPVAHYVAREPEADMEGVERRDVTP